MLDPRWEQLATILVQYSTAVQAGENVLIDMVEVDSFPLARALHRETIEAGAVAYISFQSALLERDLMRLGSTEQVKHIPQIQTAAIDWADVYFNLRGSRNPFELADVSEETFLLRRRAMGRVSALRDQNTRWVIVRLPNESFAQQAAMSLEDAFELFFQATLQDWPAESQRYQVFRDVFQAAETVRIVGRDTDLTFSTRGRTYAIDDGHINMPGGEVFTAPVDDSAEGTIRFEAPAAYFGQKIEDIQLVFSGGRVIEARAGRNEDLLRQMISLDEGASSIGEFGVGTNFNIQRFCTDLFFDEKIGGTVHLALGRAYAACGGVNQSDLHWDIVKDLRSEGAIYLDGRAVFEDGRYLFDLPA